MATAMITIQQWFLLLRGLGVTLALAACVLAAGLALGIVGGVLYAWGGRVLRTLFSTWIFMVRGVPLIVQVYFVFFVLPLWGVTLSGFVSAALTLTLFAAATITEIVRGGIEAIPRSQLDAALSVGFRFIPAMRTIVLPQAIRVVLPALVSQFVFLVKATSVVSLLGVGEFLFSARELIERTLLGFEIMAVVWVAYTIICYPLTILGRRCEATLAARGFRST
jgi:His/Glu/Gln/Arg/opine family amino acid ABC transporter permease subunit